VNGVQVMRILPESVFYGRHLLKEGDYITSVNGQSLEQFSSVECDELLTSPSNVVCIQLLRMISANDRSGVQSGCKTAHVEVPGAKDDRLDRRKGSVFRRHSVTNELNENQLFMRSKLRLSCRSGSDHGSSRHGQDSEQSRRTFTGKLAPDSTRSATRGRDEVGRSSRSAERVEENSPERGNDKLDRVPVSGDLVKNFSASESPKEPSVRKNDVSTTSAHRSHSSVDRRTVRHSKGVRFKLMTKDRNSKEKNKDDPTQKNVSSTDHTLLSAMRHKVISTEHPCVKSLPDLTKQGSVLAILSSAEFSPCQT